MSHSARLKLLWAKISDMTTTRLLYGVDNNVGTVDQFERECMGDAVERLVQLGICPAIHAKMVANKSMHCLKEAFAEKNTAASPVLWNAFLTFAAREMQSLEKKLEQNFGLTQTEFDNMATALRAGDKSMFEVVFFAHFAACRSFVARTYGASAEDAYDATMDTLMDFYHKLIEGKIQYGNLRYLFTKMAGQCYLKSRHHRSETQKIPGHALLSSDDSLDHDADRILDKAWEKLCEECRHILKSFYYDRKNLYVLATEMGKDHTAMRKQKQRCVDKLRAHFMRFL